MAAHDDQGAAAGDHRQEMHGSDDDAEELLRAHQQLWSHSLGYVKTMALKCALDLRIPDTIQRRGGAATLDDLLAGSDLPPSSRPYLRRLMRALTALRVFALRHDDPAPAADDADAAPAAACYYELTATSRLLLGGGASYFSLLPVVRPLVQTPLVAPMLGMRDWMTTTTTTRRPDDHHGAACASLLEMASGGKSLWESVRADAGFRAGFFDSMDADSRLVMHAVLRDSPAVFRGVASLVDVGGGRGTAAAAVAAAFPHIQCTVMDLPHVVAEAPAPDAAGRLSFVAGDMFERIPPADALLLKWILHDWDDANCVKIMRRCREAISRNGGGGGREGGRGKVIIIDAVIGFGCSNKDDDETVICKETETQVLCDLYMMAASNGAEREEQEWRRIFSEAGFSDYKITHIRGGVPSVIEVYPSSSHA